MNDLVDILKNTSLLNTRTGIFADEGEDCRCDYGSTFSTAISSTPNEEDLINYVYYVNNLSLRMCTNLFPLDIYNLVIMRDFYV